MMPFPPLPEEDLYLAHLYAYLDESGKESDPIIVFSGFVDRIENWRKFQNEWAQLLRRYEIPEFHARPALRYSQPYGKMLPGTAKERTADILPFVHAITRHLELGVLKALDVTTYKAADPLIHRVFGTDPIYFGFYMAIEELLHYFEIPKNATIGLILDS
jgi:hypothetical protein